MTRLSRPKHVVARSRSGRALSAGPEITALLIPGEMLQPAARRVLAVLLSDEGSLFGFDELATLSAIGGAENNTIEHAERLHRHVHYIRRALRDDFWVESVIGNGFTFRRRVRRRA